MFSASVFIFQCWTEYFILYPKMTVEPSRVREVSKYYITLPRASLRGVTADSALHDKDTEWVSVTGKSTGTKGSYTRYLHVWTEGEERSLSVTNKLYMDTEEGSRIRLCRRTSIFGYEYWILHK